MIQNNLFARKLSLLATVAPMSLLVMAAPAFAQDQALPTQAADKADDAADKDIVVTGSRIARPNLESTIPITTVTGAELEQTARVSIGDVLNDLPQIRSTYSQANSTRFLGTAGLNLIDLYGLGTQRTLVLVNGRRHVGADILNNAVSPDVNTFPTDLIERVDVVTGGNSAIYGSDAIAGVVNFVLKDHYDGLQIHGQGGISQYGDAGSYYVSALGGKNFAGGRGNIAIDLEYARQNSFYASDRDYLQQNDTLIGVDVDPAGLPNGSDGNPDNVFFRDVRSATINSAGLVTFYRPDGSCGRDTQPSTIPGQVGSGLNRPFTCNFIFDRAGNLVPETGTRVGLQSIPTIPGTITSSFATGTYSPGGSFIGGNGDTRRQGQLIQLLPQLDRYSANLIGHFEVSSAFVPFIEAKYVRTDSFGTGSSGPAFITGSTLDAFYERPRLDNPYLSSQARTLITQQLIASGVPSANISGSTRFVIRKNLLDLGVRSEQAKRETYRIVVGARGTFNDDWNYEVSANYGEFKERTKVLGNLNVQRFLLAMDSTTNGAGQIVCRGVPDPAFGGVDLAGNAAVLAADIAACQPLNPFGDGNVSQAAKNYVLSDTVSVGKITQLDLSAFVSGNTGKFLNLPGGPVGFAVGAEYRRETAFFQEDPLVEAGYTFYNSIAKFAPPAFEVKEAYAELRLPVLKDVPFFSELTLSGSGRVADYNGSTGTVYAYSGGVDYAPIQDIRFRANYARSVRAPNLSELYTPNGQNFAPGFRDPCSAANIATGTQYRAANCASAGIPTTYDYTYSQSLEIVSGGNPDLKAEKSDSYTYGVVVQPRFVPGLSISVDYYNIAVNNVITAPSAQAIANACYDTPTTANQFCAQFQRDDAAGTVTGTPFRIIEASLVTQPLNYAKLKVRGINTEIAYVHKLGANNSIGGRFVYTHQLENSAFLDPTQPGFADSFRGEVGDPVDAYNINLDGKFGPVFINYQFRYLSKQAATSIEALQSFQGRPASNLDFADIPYYKSVTYHNIRFGVDIMKGSNFYFGIDNFTDTRPPLGSTAIGGGSGIYDSVGRRFYAGINAKF